MVRHRDLVAVPQDSGPRGSPWPDVGPASAPAAGRGARSIEASSADAAGAEVAGVRAAGSAGARTRTVVLRTVAALALLGLGFAGGVLAARMGLAPRPAVSPTSPPVAPSTLEPPAETAPAAGVPATVAPATGGAPAGAPPPGATPRSAGAQIVTGPSPGPLYVCIVVAPAPASGEARLAQDLRGLGLGDPVELPGPPPRRLRVGGPLALREALDLAAALSARGHDVQIAPQPREAGGSVRAP